MNHPSVASAESSRSICDGKIFEFAEQWAKAGLELRQVSIADVEEFPLAMATQMAYDHGDRGPAFVDSHFGSAAKADRPAYGGSPDGIRIIWHRFADRSERVS